MPNSTCRLWAGRLAAVVSLGVLAGASVQAQSVEREMVVSVLDESLQPVAGLTPSDFIIREDGAAREVLRVSPDTAEREIILLVDTSENIRPVQGDIRRAATAFVRRMTEQHPVAIVSFGGTPMILSEATRDLEQLEDAIGQIFGFPGNAAYLLDAVSETMQGIERRNVPRPVLVVLTTLGLEYSLRDARPLIRRMEEADVPFYSMVYVNRRANRAQSAISQSELDRQLLERDLLLDLGATQTGGRRRDMTSSAASAAVIEDIASDLLNQYLVVYARPDALIPPEDIRVEVTRAGLTARGTALRVAD